LHAQTIAQLTKYLNGKISPINSVSDPELIAGSGSGSGSAIQILDPDLEFFFFTEFFFNYNVDLCQKHKNLQVRK